MCCQAQCQHLNKVMISLINCEDRITSANNDFVINSIVCQGLTYYVVLCNTFQPDINIGDMDG